MTEEQVTKAILACLINGGWNIVTYDFPQSGTGKMLRPNNHVSDKNRGGFIPDIVTFKDGVCIFFENKDKVVIKDFKKVSALINENKYMNDISTLLAGYNVTRIFYGVGFPSNKWNKSAEVNVSFVDFIVGVTDDKKIEFLYNPNELHI